MRYREPFTLYKRTLPSSKQIWYFQTYDKNDKRLAGRSTGEKVKTKARIYCLELMKSDKLIPDKKLIFGEYAKDWFIYDKCPYIQQKLKRGGSFGRTYAANSRMMLEAKILPVFSKMEMSKISSQQIEKWLMDMTSTGLANKTINSYLMILRMILKEAKRMELIEKNPAEVIQPLMKQTRSRGIVTREEFQKLFEPTKEKKIWTNQTIRTMNLLAALTGMRMGEIQGLQSIDVHDDHVFVHHSLSKGDGLKGTKTNDERRIPVPPLLSKLLKYYKGINSTGYVFSHDGGVTPVHSRSVTKVTYRAYERVGITSEIRIERNINFHSWRHFFNSTLRAGNVSDAKVQRLTGHRTQAMTENYTHFGLGDFRDVLGIQEGLLGEGN